MANDRNVKLGIETVQEGTGAKDTATDLERLEDAVDVTDAGARELRDEMVRLERETGDAGKEVGVMAARLEGLADEGRKAIVRVKELERAEGELGEASDEAARSLSDVTDELADQERVQGRTKVGVDDLRRSLSGMSEDELRRTLATRKATGATREGGVAAREAAAALGSMRGGVNGVLRDLPGLLVQLGGKAGLAGIVISVAVGLGKLANDLLNTTDKIKEMGVAAARSAELQTEAARRERAARQQMRQEVEGYGLVLDEERKALLQSVTAFDDLTSAMQRQYAAAQAIANEQLALDISVVQNDAGLSELEKVVRISELKIEAARREEAAVLESLANERAGLASKIDAGSSAQSAAFSEGIARQRELRREIERSKQVVEDLKDSYAELVLDFQSKRIPEVDKLVNNPLANGGAIGVADREDFGDGLAGDRRFLNAADADVTEGDSDAQGLIDSTEALLNQIEAQKRLLDAEKLATEELEKKLALSEADSEATQSRLKSEIEAAVKQSKVIDEQIEKEEKLLEIREKRRGIEASATVESAAGSEIQKEVSELSSGLDADLASAGASAEEIKTARAKATELGKTVTDALKDGVVDPGDLAKISEGLGQLKTLLNGSFEATNRNLAELNAALLAQAKAQQTLQRQIQEVQRVSGGL